MLVRQKMIVPGIEPGSPPGYDSFDIWQGDMHTIAPHDLDVSASIIFENEEDT